VVVVVVVVVVISSGQQTPMYLIMWTQESMNVYHCKPDLPSMMHM